MAQRKPKAPPPEPELPEFILELQRASRMLLDARAQRQALLVKHLAAFAALMANEDLKPGVRDDIFASLGFLGPDAKKDSVSRQRRQIVSLHEAAQDLKHGAEIRELTVRLVAEGKSPVTLGELATKGPEKFLTELRRMTRNRRPGQVTKSRQRLGKRPKPKKPRAEQQSTDGKTGHTAKPVAQRPAKR